MARHALPQDSELHGRYRIDTTLGAGGFGITYLGRDEHLGRAVAIKEYFPTEFAIREGQYTVRSLDTGHKQFFALGRTWFLREARTLAKYRHPHIVGVMDHFEENDTAYMVLNFEEGQKLSSWLRALRRAPTQAELDAILLPLLSALEAMHKNNDLHRDVAMDNIIVRSDGDPVLIDFGSARQAIGHYSRSIDAVVKYGYSPPEQYSVDPKLQGPWSDIYALAATLYSAITGKLPPDAPGRQLDDSYEPLAASDFAAYRHGLLKGIDWGLALKPADRPQSVSDWRRLLLSMDDEPLAADPAAPVGGQAAAIALADAAPSGPASASASRPRTGARSGPSSRSPSRPSSAEAANAGAAGPGTVFAPLSSLPDARPRNDAEAGPAKAAAALLARSPAIEFGGLALAVGAGVVLGVREGIHWAYGPVAVAVAFVGLLLFAGIRLLGPTPEQAAPRAAFALGLPWLLPLYTAVISLPLFALAWGLARAPRAWHGQILQLLGVLHVASGLLWPLAAEKLSPVIGIASAGLLLLGFVAWLAGRAAAAAATASTSPSSNASQPSET